MVYKITWTYKARKDLKAIKEYIEQDSLLYAEKLIRGIVRRTEVLKKFPESGIPVLPEKFNHLRKLLYKSYRVIYHYLNNQVTILTVHHQSRLLENIPQIKDYKE